MSTHTPGPWRINDTVASNRFALEIEAGPEGDPFTVCCIEDGTQWVDEDEATAAEQRDVANAKLIAAAPELLAACKMAVALIELKCSDNAGAIELLHKAIVKADQA